MESDRVRSTLEAIASKVIGVIVPLEQTQALVMRKDQKLDRVDIKIMKEAEKLNRKEQRYELKCEGPRPAKRKGSITYRSYSIDFKKKLIASIREQIRGNNENLSKIIREKARQLKIHPKNITRWYHTKELKKKEGGRKALYPQMEVRLANFILNNPTMRRKHILRQAKEIMEELNIPGRQQFNFSKGWYQRFRERLNKSKIFAEIKSEDSVKYEVKLEHLNYNDDLKQEDQNDYTEESFVSDDQSDYSEEAVKLEEQLSDQEQYKIPFTCHQMADRSYGQKQVSLFFEEEEGQKGKGNVSLLNLLEGEEETMHSLVRVIK